MTWTSTLSHLECARCGRHENAEQLINLCPCGGPLVARYDLDQAGKALDPARLRQRSDRSLWRYRELLPVRDEKHAVSLGEGCTPLLRMPGLEADYGMSRLYMKDEGLNPTGTFKARGATTGISRAKELGATSIAMPTNGNAGGAWATYGKRAGLDVILCMPTDAPQLAIVEAAGAGAHIACIRGQISDAGAVIASAAERYGWFEAATLKEPYRIEGKKTMAIELLEDLDWQLPDAIVYPTGGGVGIIGIYKALLEMQTMGWIDGPLPKLFAVQADGCAPVVAAFEAGLETTTLWPDAETVAQGIRVPKALGDFMVLDAVRETGGVCLSVSDAEILEALGRVGEADGVFICPEGAAAVAAVPQLVERDAIQPDDVVVILNTGSGLKYPDVVTAHPAVIDPGDPLPAAVVEFTHGQSGKTIGAGADR